MLRWGLAGRKYAMDILGKTRGSGKKLCWYDRRRCCPRASSGKQRHDRQAPSCWRGRRGSVPPSLMPSSHHATTWICIIQGHAFNGTLRPSHHQHHPPLLAHHRDPTIPKHPTTQPIENHPRSITMADAAKTPDQADEAPIDETPISPASPEVQRRRSSLEQHLQHRPERDDLVESCVPGIPLFLSSTNGLGNILPKSTAAPSLQAQEKEVRLKDPFTPHSFEGRLLTFVVGDSLRSICSPTSSTTRSRTGPSRRSLSRGAF